jgi:hypothetical protein
MWVWVLACVCVHEFGSRCCGSSGCSCPSWMWPCVCVRDCLLWGVRRGGPHAVTELTGAAPSPPPPRPHPCDLSWSLFLSALGRPHYPNSRRRPAAPPPTHSHMRTHAAATGGASHVADHFVLEVPPGAAVGDAGSGHPARHILVHVPVLQPVPCVPHPRCRTCPLQHLPAVCSWHCFVHTHARSSQIVMQAHGPTPLTLRQHRTPTAHTPAHLAPPQRNQSANASVLPTSLSCCGWCSQCMRASAVPRLATGGGGGGRRLEFVRRPGRLLHAWPPGPHPRRFTL